MEIIIAKTAGFCMGVARAVEAAKKQPAGSLTYGEIIHNESVVNELKGLGIGVAECIDECKGKNVVIRSHGVGESDYKTLSEECSGVIDATCPFVKKIHNIVNDAHKSGNRIIIIGEPKHPEVVGTNGWCDGSATLINNEDTANSLIDNGDVVTVVCQTTFSEEKAKKIIEIIKNRLKTVEFFDTICYTTKDRQREARELASNCDIMLVIGSENSSNTLKLYEISKEYCKNTFLISRVSDLSKNNVVKNNFQRLGITAGASTPYELIREVANIMSESQNKEMTAVEPAMSEFEQYMAQSQEQTKIKAGQKEEVTVISASDAGIKVSFGAKVDGIIAADEVEANPEDYNPSNYVEGMTFEAEFLTGKSIDGSFPMSKRRIEIRAKEAKECEEVLRGSEFTVKIEKAVKGGLLSKLGPYTIFVPQSHIKLGYENNLEKYVGKEMRLRMIPPKKDEESQEEDNGKLGRRIVASHKIILEEEKFEREELFWGDMVEGVIVNGKVKRFTDFGAFVNVNGFDCLAHISDLSWTKVKEPSDVLEINKSYDFVVLKADRSTGKVSLGYKQLQKKPYEEAQEKYPVGTVVKGIVERIYPYGAFVTIDKGIDGLIPVSEIAYSYVKDANDAFTAGQEVEAQIIKFDGTKITLSVKALLTAPERVEDVVLSDDDIQEAKEKRAKANARKFDSTQAPKRPRAKKTNEVREEMKSWTSEESTATFADLFKGLNFDVNNDDKE